MTSEEAVRVLVRIGHVGISKKMLKAVDIEGAHQVADAVLLEYLRSNGHSQVADAYEEARAVINFAYA